jgi:hypothetical protein
VDGKLRRGPDHAWIENQAGQRCIHLFADHTHNSV